MPKRLWKDETTATPTYAKFVAEPFETGYGYTLGNALRRVLLSSLEGAAITNVKIEGAMHEFTTIEDVVEPYLMQLGLLQRTPRGRVATRETYRYLGIPYPDDSDGKPKIEQPSLL